LVAELQERGVYPTEYAGATLRENLGLAVPVRPVADDSSGDQAGGDDQAGHGDVKLQLTVAQQQL
jgi:hypothetical protein